MKSASAPYRSRFVASVSALLLIQGLSATVSQAQSTDATPPASTVTRTPVAPGVTLIQEIVPATSPQGPLTINLIEIDPKQKGVRLTATLGQDRVWGKDATNGREIVSSLAKRHQATAAINAGFFPFAGNPIGLHMQSGEIVTEPMNNRTCFAILDDNTPAIEAFTYTGIVTAGTDKNQSSLKLNGMNRRARKEDDLLLFTPTFFDSTLKSQNRTEVVLSGITEPIRPNQTYTGKVIALNMNGTTPIAKNTVVLSGSGFGALFLQLHAPIGASLSFRLNIDTVSGKPFPTARIREAVAGGPRLIADGNVSITAETEGFQSSLYQPRHPRTAVGITKTGKILLAVVDGRQPKVSRGVSLEELANLFLKYDVVNAVNLDGGGSTTAVVQDLIVNSPSEGAERPVANALLVFASSPDKKGKQPLASGTLPELMPKPEPLQLGDSFTCTPLANGKKGLWGVTAGIGFVSQTGIFTATRPGTGKVFFRPDGGKEVRELPIQVLAPEKAPSEKKEDKEVPEH